MSSKRLPYSRLWQVRLTDYLAMNTPISPPPVEEDIVVVDQVDDLLEDSPIPPPVNNLNIDKGKSNEKVGSLSSHGLRMMMLTLMITRLNNQNQVPKGMT